MTSGLRPSLVALSLATAATLAAAHAQLEASTPAEGATIDAAPSTARLRFSERVEPALTTVTLIGPGEATIALGQAKAEGADGRVVVVPLPALKPGAYRVRWTTMGPDAHRMRGEIRFRVK